MVKRQTKSLLEADALRVLVVELLLKRAVNGLLTPACTGSILGSELGIRANEVAESGEIISVRCWRLLGFLRHGRISENGEPSSRSVHDRERSCYTNKGS
jgi:hypothetical protein